MFYTLSLLAQILYFAAAFGLLIYGFNCYIMIFLFRRRISSAARERKTIIKQYGDLAQQNNVPVVTTQIAIYNELNVAERCMRAVCALEYPEGKHEIQVLDDSTDETINLVDKVALELKNAGHDISVIRRKERIGYKAGALNNGMEIARGEIIAIFDADFVPTRDYLTKLIPFFLADEKIGLVQARWGHLNRKTSLLTRAQSIGIDGHFMVEQSARNWNGLFMNFNGTAGAWRKSAIKDSGGWEWDTLTEDMDLSYRVQMKGWKTKYLPDLVVPAEIPEDVNAFKIQQFRWAKGSIQTAIKILPGLLKSDIPLFVKIQSFFHMTHYIVHILMLTLAVLALPVLLTLNISLAPTLFAVMAVALAFSMMAPSTLYFFSQRAAYSDWAKRLLLLPFLVIIGVGIAISNSRGVLEAIIGKETEFVRTPKRGDTELKRYTSKVPWIAILEIALGAYCATSMSEYILAGKYLVGPFLAIYAAGYLFIGLLTISQNIMFLFPTKRVAVIEQS